MFLKPLQDLVHSIMALSESVIPSPIVSYDGLPSETGRRRFGQATCHAYESRSGGFRTRRRVEPGDGERLLAESFWYRMNEFKMRVDVIEGKN